MAPKRAAAKRKAASPSEDDLTPSESEHQSPSDHEDEPVAKKRKTAGPSKAKTKATAGTKGKTQGQSKGKGKAENQKPTGGETGTSSIAAEDGRQPTNKVLPVHIAFAPKAAEDTVRIAAWNICGLAAAQKKGFKYYVEAEDPDVLILTETKVNNDPVDPALTQRFPYRYWSISDKKTYSGTAILSKVEPISVDYTLPGHPDPKNVKGRIVTLEFASCYLVGTYVVNAGTGLKVRRYRGSRWGMHLQRVPLERRSTRLADTLRFSFPMTRASTQTLDEKKVWNAHFEAYIRQLDKKKPVIWAGDLNVAPTEIDLANPKTNWNKTPGYTEAETSSFARILNASGEEADAGKFVDVWRDKHPGLRHYTYFSYRFNCREKGLGWRLDMFVVSERMAERVQMCEIRSEIYGASDHCPVVLELKGPL